MQMKRHWAVFQGIDKSLQGSTPPYLGPDGMHLSRVTVVAARESDLLAGSQSTLGRSSGQGLHCELFKNRKTCVAFSSEVRTKSTVFIRKLYRSGVTSSS